MLQHIDVFIFKKNIKNSFIMQNLIPERFISARIALHSGSWLFKSI